MCLFVCVFFSLCVFVCRFPCFACVYLLCVSLFFVLCVSICVCMFGVCDFCVGGCECVCSFVYEI